MKVQLGVEDVSVGELRVGVCKVGLSCLTFGQHAAHTTGSPLLLSSVTNGLSSSGSLRNSETLRSPHLQQFLLGSDFNGGTTSFWSSILADLRDAYVCLSWHGYGHRFTQGGEVLHILLPLNLSTPFSVVVCLSLPQYAKYADMLTMHKHSVVTTTKCSKQKTQCMKHTCVVT